MVFLIVYLIIGVGLLTYSSIRQAMKEQDFVEVKLKSLFWWVATILCVIFWPVLLGGAIYDAVKIIKEILNEPETGL